MTSIGDTLPPASPPRYFGDEITPRWHCVITPPSPKFHTDCRQFLRDAGMYAFFPSEERVRVAHGKAVTTEAPMLPGYVFAQFKREPRWYLWHRLKWFARVFRIGDRPYVFDYSQIRHLQGLTVDADRLREAQDAMQAAAIAAARPIAGQPARVISGPFAGQTVTPSSITADEAMFEIMGVKIRADTGILRRA